MECIVFRLGCCVLPNATPESSRSMLFNHNVQVLVVDDDPMCLKVVSAMLKRCNYEGMFPCISLYSIHFVSNTSKNAMY